MPPERLRRWWHSLDRWQRAAVIVWGVGLVLLCGKAALQPHRNTVYPIFADAGRHWLAGTDLYEIPPNGDGYRYSPLVAAFFVPFGLLPDALGGVLWRLVCAAVFLGGLAWWRRAVLPPTLTRAQRALLWLLPAPLALGNVHNGQANILIMGLLLLAVAAVARDRFSLAAGCVAVACLFKLYPIAVGLLLVLLHPRRLAPRLLVMLGVGMLLPFVLQRADFVAAQYADWVEHMRGNDRQLTLPRENWYRDVRLLWSSWVAPMSYGAYLVLQAASAAVVAGACLWARRTGLARPRLLTLLLGLGCCWMTALGPASESATYVLLGPCAAWLLLAGRVERHPPALRLLWLAGYALLVGSQAASILPWGRAVHAMGPQPIAALLILGGLLYLAVWRHCPADSSFRARFTERETMNQAYAKPQAAATDVAVGAHR